MDLPRIGDVVIYRVGPDEAGPHALNVPAGKALPATVAVTGEVMTLSVLGEDGVWHPRAGVPFVDSAHDPVLPCAHAREADTADAADEEDGGKKRRKKAD